MSDASTRARAEESRRVDRDLDAARREAERQVKLLLLGSGESGKSTIFKQMRILHGKGFSQGERARMVGIIRQNVVTQMQVLVEMALEFKKEIKDAEAAEAFSEDGPEAYDAEVAALVKRLWADPGIQEAYALRSRFQLDDSASYFFEKAEEMSAHDYVATTDDVLHMRVKTMGVVAEEFTMEGTKFVMYDMGGQRSERKKWVHCFEDVTAVIFVASLSEYDQVLYEDVTQNRMEESLKLFDEMANSRWLEHTAFILFLNKRDLFEEKIKEQDIRHKGLDGKVHFPDYSGGCDFKKGLKYIIRQFIKRNRNEARELFYHVTTATNTENIATVFNACKEIILMDNVEATDGFLE